MNGLNILTAFLPGVQVTYQGEELGMTDGKVDCKDGRDQTSDCKLYPSITRDFERTPFQWSAETNAGFSEGKKLWLPVADNYKTINVAVETKLQTSSLKIYKAAQQLRIHLRANATNNVKVLDTVDKNVLGLRRGSNSDGIFEYFFNMNDKPANISLSVNGKVQVLTTTSQQQNLE